MRRTVYYPCLTYILPPSPHPSTATASVWIQRGAGENWTTQILFSRALELKAGAQRLQRLPQSGEVQTVSSPSFLSGASSDRKKTFRFPF